MMKSLRYASLVLAVCCAAPAAAQSPTPAQPDDTLSPGVTETWASPGYEQPTAEPTPRELLRAREQAKAQQRQNRMAARKWFGYSNLRPTVSPTPWAGGYSPTWVSNTAQPFMWSGVSGLAGVGVWPGYGGYYW